MMCTTMRVFVAFLLALASAHGFSVGDPLLPSKVALQRQESPSTLEVFQKAFVQGLLVGCLAFPQMAAAVSGGGLDYANLDITGEDFSNGKYKGKDFTQVSPSRYYTTRRTRRLQKNLKSRLF